MPVVEVSLGIIVDSLKVVFRLLCMFRLLLRRRLWVSFLLLKNIENSSRRMFVLNVILAIWWFSLNPLLVRYPGLTEIDRGGD